MPDVAIAIGEFNRFSTELQNVALSASNHNLEVMGAGGAFLLQTTDDRPFVAVIKDREDASRSAMVRFVPTRGIAARDVNITGFPMGGEKPGATVPKPISDAFEVEAKTLLKAVVLRQMPRGFALAKGRGGPADVCRLPGTTTREAQILEGAHFRIRVFALTNDGPDDAEIDEAQCDGQSVLAATSWPQRQLKHGDRIELFVLEAKTQSQPSVAVRPSAI